MDNVVTKSNELIEASYRLSLNEARILFYGISLINPLSGEFPLEYRIDVKKFAEMFNLDSHNVYETIKEIVMDKFWEREFTIPTENHRKFRGRWLIGVEYSDHQGFLKIFFHPKIQPFLSQLKKNFTSYYLEKIVHFKSIYSIRFYEITIMRLNKSMSNKDTFSLPISEIKEKMALSDKYQRFSNFKDRVLERAKKEINKHSDIHLSYKIKKLGRSPHEIEFTVTRKTEKSVPILKPPSDKLTPAMIEKGKKAALGSGWDIYTIEQQFYSYIKQKGAPSNLEGAFIGFVKKKILNPP